MDKQKLWDAAVAHNGLDVVGWDKAPMITIENPDELESLMAAIQPAAAPQVVADGELPPLPVCHELMPFKGYPVTEGICCYTAQQMTDYARTAIAADPLKTAAMKFIEGWDKAHRDEKYDELIFSALPCIEEMRAAANFMAISKSWESCPTLETYTSADFVAAPAAQGDLRNAISNAIACQGDILQDHNGTVEAIYAAIAAKAAS